MKLCIEKTFNAPFVDHQQEKFNEWLNAVLDSTIFLIKLRNQRYFTYRNSVWNDSTWNWTLNTEQSVNHISTFVKFEFSAAFFHKLVPFIGPLCILVKGLFMLFNIINSIYWIPSCILCNVHLMKMVCTWIFELFVLWIFFSLFYVILFLREIKKLEYSSTCSEKLIENDKSFPHAEMHSKHQTSFMWHYVDSILSMFLFLICFY